jgi:hypothetical protein
LLVASHDEMAGPIRVYVDHPRESTRDADRRRNRP